MNQFGPIGEDVGGFTGLVHPIWRAPAYVGTLGGRTSSSVPELGLGVRFRPGNTALKMHKKL
ncbi:unannotated protein [freshwater metagenome]|uniref:Unannotated protein n=1 Tax=freshwater metagenome TaxID=449393 RepID=A0A6J6U388_9ZZZZ